MSFRKWEYVPDEHATQLWFRRDCELAAEVERKLALSKDHVPPPRFNLVALSHSPAQHSTISMSTTSGGGLPPPPTYTQQVPSSKELYRSLDDVLRKKPAALKNRRRDHQDAGNDVLTTEPTNPLTTTTNVTTSSTSTTSTSTGTPRRRAGVFSLLEAFYYVLLEEPAPISLAKASVMIRKLAVFPATTTTATSTSSTGGPAALPAAADGGGALVSPIEGKEDVTPVTDPLGNRQLRRRVTHRPATRAVGTHTTTTTADDIVDPSTAIPDATFIEAELLDTVKHELRRKGSRSPFRELLSRYYLARREKDVLTYLLVTSQYRRLGLGILLPLKAYYIPHEAEHRFLYIDQSTLDAAGLGLFVRPGRWLPRGTILCEYLGPRQKTPPRQNAQVQSYTIRTQGGEFISGMDDAGTVMCLAAVANDGGRHNTAELAEFREMPNRVFIVAGEHLPGGTEVLVPYGATYWGMDKESVKEVSEEVRRRWKDQASRSAGHITAPETTTTTETSTQPHTTELRTPSRGSKSKVVGSSGSPNGSPRAAGVNNESGGNGVPPNVMVDPMEFSKMGIPPSRCRACKTMLSRRFITLHQAECCDPLCDATAVSCPTKLLPRNEFTMTSAKNPSLESRRRAVHFADDDWLHVSMTHADVTDDDTSSASSHEDESEVQGDGDEDVDEVGVEAGVVAATPRRTRPHAAASRKRVRTR